MSDPTWRGVAEGESGHPYGTENRDLDASGGLGTTEYVKQMYENRRAIGLNDPQPANKKAARYAPGIGTRGGKKYRAANGGL